MAGAASSWHTGIRVTRRGMKAYLPGAADTAQDLRSDPGDCLREIFRLEGLKIVNPLADTDEIDR